MDIAKVGFQVDTSELDKGSRKLKGMQSAALLFTKATALMVKTLATFTQAQGLASKATVSAMNSLAQEATELVRAAEATNLLTRAKRQATKAANDQAAAESKLQSGFGGGAFEGRDQMVNRFNTGNIAAQFQDIGVTAAMGMSPMMIALQQGTQLSAIMNSMQNPVRGLAAAFKTVINPLSLMTIGLTALVAAGLQMIDWQVTVRQGALLLAEGLETVKGVVVDLVPALTLLGITFGILNIGGIVGMVGKLTKAMWGLLASIWAVATANPFGLLVTGITGVLTALYTFRDAINQYLGVDLLGVLKTAGNTIIGVFAGAYNAIKTTFNNLPAYMGSVMVEMGNFMLESFENILNKMNNMLSVASRGYIKLPTISFQKWENAYAAELEQSGANLSKAFQDGFTKDYIGGITSTIEKGMTYVIDKVTTFGNSPIPTKDSNRKTGKTEAEKYEDLVSATQRRIASLYTEQKAIGLSTVETDKLKHAQELLNTAQEKGITLTTSQQNELSRMAIEMANIEEQTRKATEAYELMRDTGKGLFTDFVSGLKNGESAWRSFSDAAINALNRILDKLLDVSLNTIFSAPGLQSSIGGFFSSVVGANTTEFANGGAFTNNVVNSPTLFKFANGGKLGVMGEAGAEAVMPLTRGSDGSLGVQTVGGGGSGDVVVNVVNNSGAQARTQERQTSNGREIDVIIDDVVAQKIASRGSSSNNALSEVNNRQLIRR